MQAKDVLVKTPAPVKAAPKAPSLKVEAKPASMTADARVEAKKPQRPVKDVVAKVPGEDVRNGASIFGQVFGPIVTVQETAQSLKGVSLVSKLANIPFIGKAVQLLAPAGEMIARSPIGKAVVRQAQGFAKLPLFRSPAFQAVWGKVKPALKGLSVLLTAFDGYAFVRTLFNKDASVARKALTGGRFLANLAALIVMFRMPQAGVALANIPAFLGNICEYALMWLNGKEAKAAKA